MENVTMGLPNRGLDICIRMGTAATKRKFGCSRIEGKTKSPIRIVQFREHYVLMVSLELMVAVSRGYQSSHLRETSRAVRTNFRTGGHGYEPCGLTTG